MRLTGIWYSRAKIAVRVVRVTVDFRWNGQVSGVEHRIRIEQAMSKWKPPKADEVKKKEQEKRKFEEKLALIAEYLTEEDFQEAITDFKPTLEQRREWTMLFRAYQRRKRGL